MRFLSNPSSGKMGYALAQAATELGWVVDLVSGPCTLPVPEHVAIERVVTGEEMYKAVSHRFPACDILIMTAAIMDYRPKAIADHKIKKFELEMVIEMEPVIDVLATVAREKEHQLIVGFAAETNKLDEFAEKKLQSKNADFIVANYIGGSHGAFEKDDNTIHLFSRTDPAVEIGPLPKLDLARRLLEIFKAPLMDKVASNLHRE